MDCIESDALPLPVTLGIAVLLGHGGTQEMQGLRRAGATVKAFSRPYYYMSVYENFLTFKSLLGRADGII